MLRGAEGLGWQEQSWPGELRAVPGELSAVPVQVSASQGRQELALGRCWVIFCLSHSIIPVLVKAGSTFLHSLCHGKGQTTAPGGLELPALGCGCTEENLQGLELCWVCAWEQSKAEKEDIPATGSGKPLLLAGAPYLGWA